MIKDRFPNPRKKKTNLIKPILISRNYFFTRGNIVKSFESKEGFPDMDKFLGLPGIGPAKAESLYKKYGSLAKTPKNELPTEAQLAIDMNLRKRIPRATITRFMARLNDVAPEKFTIAGSYRRGLPSSRDIDLMTTITSNQAGYLLDQAFGGVVRYQSGKTKSAFYVPFGPGAIKVDVFHATKSSWWTMLTYLTGSKEFNIRMRSVAKFKGYLLNQESLQHAGKKIKITGEKDLFDKLGMKWTPPKNRN